MRRLLLLAAILAPGAATAASTGPQPSLTGAPAGGGLPAEMTCHQCHASFPLSPDDRGKITLAGLPERYAPGERYALTLTIEDEDADRARWGFQVTALATRTFVGAGELAVTDAAETQKLKGAIGGREYLSHSYGGTHVGETGGASWRFDWIAPKESVGDVAFFAVGNAANADGSQNGDIVYTTSPEPLAVVRGPETQGAAVQEARGE